MQSPNPILLKLNSIDLTYREWGQGEPVIMLHGLADHGLVWQGVAAELGDRYRLLAPDLRGHGDSSKPPATEYDANLLAADLEAFAQALQLKSVHVVAHSWAAKVALVWARQRPLRIRSLTLVDPYFVNQLPSLLRPTFPLFYRILPFLKVMGPFPSYEAAVAVAKTLKQYRGWSDLQETVFKAGIEQKADGTWGSKFAIAARNGVFQDVIKRSGLTAPVSTPTCLLLPEQGLNRSTWQIKPYQKHLSNLTTHSIPGNHWPHLVAPESLQGAIATWLNQHPTDAD